MRQTYSNFFLKYGFIGPTLLFLLAMNVFPFVYSVYLSLTDAQLAPVQGKPTQFIGGENYSRVFSEPQFARAIRTTAIFVFFAVSCELVLGFILALQLRDRFKFPGKVVVLTILLIPMMLSPAVMGLFWSLILDGNIGIVNQALGALLNKPPHQLPQWLTTPHLKLFTILVIDIWMWTPFMMLISLAGLNAIPNYIYEAAEIDRASAWTVFRKITLPMCRPLLLLAVLLRTTDAMKQFDLVMAVTGPTEPRTQTLSTLLYQIMLHQQNIGLGSAYAIVILVIVIAMAVVFTRYLDYIQKQR